MRAGLIVVSALALAACEPTAPNDGAGVGFDNYVGYDAERAAREAELSGGTSVPAGAISDEQAVANDAMTALGTTPAPQVDIKQDNAGISDENSFDAVTSRESIQENAARIQAQREAYKVIEPGALPSRGNIRDGATLVEFALSTTNNVGQPIYSRSIIAAQSRYERGCNKYASPDLAQEAFLARGGPKRDPMGLDPDGDGFACAWDPRPFRLAVQR